MIVERHQAAVERGEPILEIDLGKIRANYRLLRQFYRGKIVSAVVKTDAYGLGIEPVVGALAREGCDHFWVANLSEASRVRAKAPEAVVFSLHGLQTQPPRRFVGEGVIPVLASLGEVEACAALARATGAPVPVAIQLDTGLGRMGLQEADCARLAADPSLLAGLEIRAWTTHLAAFDDPDAPSNREQRERLMRWTGPLPSAPISLAASSGVFMSNDWHFDIARAGSALYGVQASQIRQDGLAVTYCLKAPVLRIATMPAGSFLGYRGATRLERDSIIATLGIGYGNGLPQGFGQVGMIACGEWRAKPVGGVSMNLVMADITDLPADSVEVGQMAVLLGDGQTVDDLAAALGCAPNAILTQIGTATSRVYRNQP